ncbi:MAG: hypothetical protein LQ340_007511, partial [Diploschistes diacapsis]
MNEVVRSFGTALAAGWKPLRTIVFASWDGEEYGLVGSTEWVEQYLPWLKATSIAYFNVDVSCRGSLFASSASPLLNQNIYAATSLVPSPNQTIPGQTVADLWDGDISIMGSGSDFTAFQDFAGIPSLDIGFGSGPGDPVYHYHSNYDSFHWMSTYNDQSFTYHTAVSKVLNLLTAHLVETPVLALNTTDYARQLAVYLEAAKTHANAESALPLAYPGHKKKDKDVFASIEAAIARFLKASVAFDAHAAKLAADFASISASTLTTDPENGKDNAPWWRWPRTNKNNKYNLSKKRLRLLREIRKVNTKYKLLERKFLHEEGLDGRSWFKHVVFAPGRWTGYAGETFPGLVEGLEDGDVEA